MKQVEKSRVAARQPLSLDELQLLGFSPYGRGDRPLRMTRGSAALRRGTQAITARSRQHEAAGDMDIALGAYHLAVREARDNQDAVAGIIAVSGARRCARRRTLAHNRAIQDGLTEINAAARLFNYLLGEDSELTVVLEERSVELYAPVGIVLPVGDYAGELREITPLPRPAGFALASFIGA